MRTICGMSLVALVGLMGCKSDSSGGDAGVDSGPHWVDMGSSATDASNACVIFETVDCTSLTNVHEIVVTDAITTDDITTVIGNGQAVKWTNNTAASIDVTDTDNCCNFAFMEDADSSKCVVFTQVGTYHYDIGTTSGTITVNPVR